MATTKSAKKTATKATKSATKNPVAKKEKPAVAGPTAPEKKLSALDAAAKVLTEKGVAMTCAELIGLMAVKGYWSSPNGKTPAATLQAALIREIATKGDTSRFVKTAPGRFAAATSGTVAIAKGRKRVTKPAATPEPPIPDGTPGPESVAELFRV